jgi:aryl-alcohol dehydrogenase-like predicted oxidoreductase
MRFRALDKSGQAVSGLTLGMDGDTPPAERQSMLLAALEAGINCFDLAEADLTLFDDLAPVLDQVERNLLFVSVRLGTGRDGSGAIVRDFSPDRLMGMVETITARSGLGYLDLCLLDDPAGPELPLTSLNALKAAREEQRIRRLGIAGAGDAMDAYITSSAFDVLVTPYSLISGWQDRNRLKDAAKSDMAVIGYNYYPPELQPQQPAGEAAVGGLFSRLMGKPAPVAAPPIVEPLRGYHFLERTKNWTPEDICLAYAMTEPGLASVLIRPRSTEHLASLALVPDRELPSNLPAQIEMARFSSAGDAA